jgi:amino acid adenylation domain-containing protein/non-ribosomal peptide synthase protein (TIGR01720 family)
MKRIPPAATYALSPMQQGMLFHYLKDPHSGVDIEQIVVHLPEKIDAAQMERAWQWLVRRHEVLRTRFIWEGQDTLQEVIAKVVTPFAVYDERGVSEKQRDERLRKYLEADRVRGFDMSVAPMLRVALLEWGEESFALVWSFHHALLDGRSYPVLLRELFEGYQELVTSGSIAERPEPYSYRRYIDWLQEQNFEAADKFWKKELAGFTAATPLVVDRQGVTESEGYRQGEAWVQATSTLTSRLRKLAEARELTLNTLVMGAWAILLHKYSREEDVVFAATRAGRKSSVENADDTVGLFINTVPVRAQIGDDDSVVSVCQAIRRLWVEMRPYEHTPLARVKGASEVPASQPLFETLFVFENYRLDMAMRALGGEWAKRHVELHELTNFPITLAAYNGEELAFKIEFDRRRLEEAAVRRMLGHLLQLLEGIAERPESTVGGLSLLTERERTQLLGEYNPAAQNTESSGLPSDGGATLHQLFEQQVARRPEAVALTCDGVSLTYAQANARANRIARKLVELGVAPETLVGLCLDRTKEIVIAILAILKSGGAYLPIDLAYPPERLAFMLEDAQAPVLLTQRELTGKLPATRAKVLCLEDVLEATSEDLAGEENLGPRSAPDNLAYVIYTSGTTGKPKGSLITHRNVVRLFPATEPWYSFNERDSWTLFHSCAFDFSVWEIWGALLYGGRVVVVPFLVSRSPEAFYELLAREKVTVLNQTPSAFRQLIQAEETIGRRELALRYVIFGGEALEMQSLRPWFERHGDACPHLVNMYGITETTVHVTYRALSKDDLNCGSVIGVPIPDLQIYILDSNGEMTPIGVPGEMHVGGAGLARGYLRRPELTAQRFIADRVTGRKGARLYRTGDLARFLPGRDIEYLGRIDHQVKIRGFRIELGEIESVLLQHEGVRSAVVMAREDEPGVKRLAAYLVITQPGPELSELREHLKKKVPDYMVPAAFVFLEKLPLTASGKVDLRVLPVPESQRPELTREYAAPRTEAEKKLAGIWEKALRVERVGVEDNFFELGGDSILSIQIISAARREGLNLTPKLLFAHQTVAALAAAAGPAEVKRPIISTAASGEAPLTPIEEWFFEQNPVGEYHYNQAFLFEVSDRLQRSVLESALRAVEQQHDALRLRFERDGKIWRQRYAAVGNDAPLDWKDLSELEEGAQRKEIEAIAARQQGSLNLEMGPLWRVTYFDLGAGRAGRLLVVVHHLAVDGVSWRPLLEDLESAYLQIAAGKRVELPTKTTSYKNWAERLKEFGKSEALRKEIPFWKVVTDPSRLEDALRAFGSEKSSNGENLEGSANKLKVKLDGTGTLALLQSVPAVYNTQVNDVLLTALAKAWKRVTGSSVLFTNLEGHGREHLFEDVDISRTVGWFTSIFPVRLEANGQEEEWRPGEALKAVKEQLRRIPRRGVGYGILRYLGDGQELAARPEPSMVFNYLGQFDQAVAGSKLFRFAAEDSGPWHSPKQKRRHALELNSMVIGGELELECTYDGASAQDEKKVRRLAEEFVAALKEIIAHCQNAQAGGRTPSDFPLATIDQVSLDRLLAGQPDVEDITALSPLQTLFFSANQGSMEAAFDQWSSTLRGALDEAAFERAWRETVQRHTILRTTIASAGLREPVQVVHRSVPVPWVTEDWRGATQDKQEKRWAETLVADRENPLSLSEVPVMRFRLIRLTDTSWKFLWSVPAMFLDGWSWPLVFRDASRLYEAHVKKESPALEAARPYRDYLEWLGQQLSEEGARFWKEQLAGLRQPTTLVSETPVRGGEGGRFPRLTIELSNEATATLQTAARRLQVTLNTLVQGAWSLVLARQSGDSEVVFGSAFSGRPADLAGVEAIVGPFTNNLPVRVAVRGEESAEEFFKKVHEKLSQLDAFQFTPLMEIQRSSEVPWRYRLFDSLIVFQNYAVDEQALRLGREVEIADFSGPIHTNYPVLLLAEPGAELRLTLVYDRKVLAHGTVKRWSEDLRTILELAPEFFEKRVSELLGLLLPQPERPTKVGATEAAQLQNFVAPQTDMEQSIASVWQKMFGLEEVGVETNFFDLGGHSLLVVQMHSLLREKLQSEFAIVALFEHPTIRGLSRYLEQPTEASVGKSEQLKDRAERQRQALARMRAPVK